LCPLVVSQAIILPKKDPVAAGCPLTCTARIGLPGRSSIFNLSLSPSYIGKIETTGREFTILNRQSKAQLHAEIMNRVLRVI
jgi:hypothetical protein